MQYSNHPSRRTKVIRMLVLDVDGTLTDGGMYYSEKGDEFKRFNSRDGMAIRRLCRGGFQVAFLSGGLGKQMAQRRAEMLHVQRCYVGERPKVETMEIWLSELGLLWDEVAYIGDDVNDLEVMAKAGLTACPADAMEVVKRKVDCILDRRGGDACVREFIDRFLHREAWSHSGNHHGESSMPLVTDMVEEENKADKDAAE